MNAVGKVTAIATPPLALGAAIHFGPDFMWQLAYNMKVPITIFTVVIGVIAFITFMNARDLMRGSAKVSDDYAIGEWRAWTAINTATVTALFWLIIQAVPSPDFDKEIKYVPKEVIKQVPVYKDGKQIVYKTPTYSDAYDQCHNAVSGTYAMTMEQAQWCHKQATEAAMPPYRTITKTITQTVHDDYKTLFDDCMGKWDHIAESDVSNFTQLCVNYASKSLPPPVQGK